VHRTILNREFWRVKIILNGWLNTNAVVGACCFALLRDRHHVERYRHNARKAKLLRGCWRKINDPTFVEWSAIINPYYDCSAICQIGDADECSER
jgi:hypothetical protein